MPHAFAEKCVHFNGTVNERCKAGVLYSFVRVPAWRSGAMSKLPCFSDADSCDARELPTEDQIREYEAKVARTQKMFKTGMSDCCEAPIDESQVITEGSHEGHGPRFCSKCHRCVFMV